MKFRKLKYGCDHVDEMHPYGYYTEHEVDPDGYGFWICPGGVFLPDDTLIEVNVVAVRSRQAPGSDMFREPWLVTACAVEKPEKPARYYLIPLDALAESS